MDEIETTNPVEGADAPETEVETEAQETETQFDDDGNPIEDQAEEEDEIEVDEETKLKLPKSQAEKLRQAMLRQADYTRKTQELAESRKAFEAERQAISQADENEMKGRAALLSIENRLAEYQKINWSAWQQSDPFAAQEAFTQYQLLKDAKSQVSTHLDTMKQERTLREQQEAAKRLEEGAAKLSEAIKDWSPQKAAKLLDVAQKDYGFSKEDMDGIDDHRVILVLNDAAAWREHQAQQKKAQATQKQAAVQPAAKASSGGSPVKPGALDDRLSAEEWLRRRNAQLAKRG